ncbi:hypothetical protein SUDANB148_02595 [Streptomyces sp. SudanB148_2056]
MTRRRDGIRRPAPAGHQPPARRGRPTPPGPFTVPSPPEGTGTSPEADPSGGTEPPTRRGRPTPPEPLTVPNPPEATGTSPEADPSGDAEPPTRRGRPTPPEPLTVPNPPEATGTSPEADPSGDAEPPTRHGTPAGQGLFGAVPAETRRPPAGQTPPAAAAPSVGAEPSDTRRQPAGQTPPAAAALSAAAPPSPGAEPSAPGGWPTETPQRPDGRAHPVAAGGPGRPGRYAALLAAMLAAVLAVSAVIFVGVSADGLRGRNAPARDGGGAGNPVAPASAGTWVTAWATAPGGGEPGTETTGLAGRSVRNVVHTTAGGTRARVTLSNLYGRAPLTLTHASIAVSAGPDTAAALAGTMRPLTFAGNPSVVVPAGGQVVSDAVRVPVPRDAHVLISTYSPAPSGPVTYHEHARQISWVAEGEHTRDTTGAAYNGQSTVWRYVTALDVLSDDSEGTVVVLGDSLTDGISSTTGADARWPDVLSGRLRAALASGRDLPRYSVVNAGLSGNRVLADGPGRPPRNAAAPRRFDRDVLGRANVRVVVVVLGVNDILRAPDTADPERIAGGLTALTERAHARGIKVVGATLMPYRGHHGWTAYGEDVRQRVNAEIRDGGVFDEVVDFDEAVRDGYDPRRLRAGHDSGDGLHPSDEGYARMAETFDLKALKGGAPARL